ATDEVRGGRIAESCDRARRAGSSPPLPYVLCNDFGGNGGLEPALWAFLAIRSAQPGERIATVEREKYKDRKRWQQGRQAVKPSVFALGTRSLGHEPGDKGHCSPYKQHRSASVIAKLAHDKRQRNRA